MIKRYNQFNDFLKEKFGERTLKVCIDGGFTSVMIDGSHHSFEDNIALTKKVVEYGKSKRLSSDRLGCLCRH